MDEPTVLDERLHILSVLYKECGERNWNGADAYKIESYHYTAAKKFLKLIPIVIPSPSQGIHPMGYFMFEWRHIRERKLTVSVDCHSETYTGLHYELVSGPLNTGGLVQLEEALPSVIARYLDLVQQKDYLAGEMRGGWESALQNYLT